MVNLEIEKKWLLRERPPLSISKWPSNFQYVGKSTIFQSYLSSGERVREILDSSMSSVYTHCTKKRIERDGEFVGFEEDEKNITFEEYKSLFRKRTKHLIKTRTIYRESSTGLKYEFDYIKGEGGSSLNFFLLEIEFQYLYRSIQEVDKHFTLPEFIQNMVLTDVTGLVGFSNHNLANKVK